VGRTGIVLITALAESLNATLKVERLHRTAYPARKKAKQARARYIGLRYNQIRLHSALGYRILQDVLDEYLERQLTA
jgi:putative transposase